MAEPFNNEKTENKASTKGFKAIKTIKSMKKEL